MRRSLDEGVTSGTAVVREGEHGDAFYVIVDGSFHVTTAGLRLGDLGQGEFFGEIALLRDVPRTATVTATSDGTLLTVRRMDFLAAILGTLKSAAMVEEVVTHRTTTSSLPAVGPSALR